MSIHIPLGGEREALLQEQCHFRGNEDFFPYAFFFSLIAFFVYTSGGADGGSGIGIWKW